MSEIKVNKISPKQTCTQLTLGDSGDTIIIPAGATITNNGTATGFGATYNGAVNWDTTPKTTTVTTASGVGYFINTTSGGVTVNLPAGTAGAVVALSDYAATWQTNNVTVNANGTEKIGGVASTPAILNTKGQSVTFVYVDSTRGWINVGDATYVAGNAFVAATGGTITTCGDYKIHTFTGPGTFTVSSAGSPAGSNSVDYLVVAGGAGGAVGAGGGGAGGYRESVPSPAAWSASPLANPGGALPVTVTGYPITVGAGGGVATTSPPTNRYSHSGSNSIFSTITSAGGGGQSSPVCINGGRENQPGSPGGSGGGAGLTCGAPGPTSGGTGNSPPVSPSQGNPGGGGPQPRSSSGGGGAGAAGTAGTTPIFSAGGAGGAGVTSSINGTPTARAGGGGGGGWYNSGPGGAGGAGGGGRGGGPCGVSSVAGTANTGGGGGGESMGIPAGGGGAAGGSGIVILRYKFQ
jgi:hypothetical protein